MDDQPFAPGIDVSHHKGLIDWELVKESGVTFAFLKATEADYFIDSRFDYNWTWARRVGLIRGAYHFFRPLVDPVAQAGHFLRRVGDILHRTDLPPVLDVEVYPTFVQEEYKSLTVSQRQQRIRLWLQTIEVATGKVPIVYTNFHTWAQFIGDTSDFSRYPLWVANYDVSQPRVPGDNWGGAGWTFWQFSAKGSVPGIKDGAPAVDLDLYKEPLSALRAWLGITGPRPVPPLMTNGDMMASLVDAAEAVSGEPDDWLRRTQLGYLIDPVANVSRPYDGPAVEEMKSLSSAEKQALTWAIESRLAVSSSAWGITNQDMLNALYHAASLDGSAGWGLVEKAELEHLVDDRQGIYTGPLIEDLPGLTLEQGLAVAEYLSVPYDGTAPAIGDPWEDQAGGPPSEDQPAGDPIPEETPEENPSDPEQALYPYPGLTNQAMINSFYNAADVLRANGWALIERAGLESMADDRQGIYRGPAVENMAGLSAPEKEVLAGNVALMMQWLQLDSSPGDAQEGPAGEPDGEPGDAHEAVETYPGVTNQAMINAFYQAAEKLGVEGWELVKKAGLAGMADNRQAAYAGPTVEAMPGLESGEKITLAVVLGFEVNQVFGESPYPGMVNQDMINLFYQAAAASGQNGWKWIERAKLTYMALNRTVRYQPYVGPKIGDLPGLDADEVAALESGLQVLAQV